MPSHFLPSSANPAMASVSRCAQVFFTRSLTRPEAYRLSRTFETTPSRPLLQACLYISRPSISKLSLDWISVSKTIFLRRALCSSSGSFVTVEVKQIEGDHHDPLGAPFEFVLLHREVRGAVLCRDHYLAIDDRRPGTDVPCVGCDLSETIGPVVTTPGEHLDGGIPEMDLDPITIELDLVNPAFAGRHLVD